MTLRERFSRTSKDYQLAAAVISDAIKAGRIVPPVPKKSTLAVLCPPYESR